MDQNRIGLTYLVLGGLIIDLAAALKLGAFDNLRDQIRFTGNSVRHLCVCFSHAVSPVGVTSDRACQIVLLCQPGCPFIDL